jgi:hypothetical protein
MHPITGSSVVLPLPDGPTISISSPRETSRSRRVTFLTDTIAAETHIASGIPSMATTIQPGTRMLAPPRELPLALAECDALLDLRHVGRRDPDIGARSIDESGGRGGEADKQPELRDDEHDRKHDAGDGDGEPDLVVNEVAPGQHVALPP